MKLEQFKHLLYKERQVVDAISTTAKQNMASILAIAAAVAIPAVPAIFAANGMYNLTETWTENWRKIAAITVGIGVEGAGIFLSQLATKTYSAWRKKIATANEVKAIVSAVMVYTIISIAFISFSDVPVALKFIVGFIPILGIAFYVGIGFETDLADRADELIEEKRRKSEQKKIATAAKHSPQNAGLVMRLPRKEWRNYAIELRQNNPEISGAELARKIGCSERSGQNILNELKNGH